MREISKKKWCSFNHFDAKSNSISEINVAPNQCKEKEEKQKKIKLGVRKEAFQNTIILSFTNINKHKCKK